MGSPEGTTPCVSGCPAPRRPAATQQEGVGVCAALQTAVLFLPAEPYTCGACGIQFQFYNNLLEHMQSHAGKDPAAGAGQMLQPPPIPFPRILQEAGPAWGHAPGDHHRACEPWSVCCNPGSVELKKLLEAVASAWSLEAI